MAKQLIDFIRDIYQTKEFIPLHAPEFDGNEKAYVNDTIDSTFVSSVGAYVDKFENDFAQYTNATGAIATVNGSASLVTALHLSDVGHGDLVITQPLTFVATCNAITQLGAAPVFIDVSKKTLGLCPIALAKYLDEYAQLNTQGQCIHRVTKRPIKAVMPMHTFGHPCRIDEIKTVCDEWHLTLIEDAAESLGSFYKGQHTGTFSRFGAFSFNGNKIITTGGGGMVIAKSQDDIKRGKHVTTTAKTPHPFQYFHDEIGYNFRLPNINAALGCAQLEGLNRKLALKRELAAHYQAFFSNSEFTFVTEPQDATSNYWLNAIICSDSTQRDELLTQTNQQGVMTRPVWTLMNKLPMFQSALAGELSNALWLESCLVNIPSSPISLAQD